MTNEENVPMTSPNVNKRSPNPDGIYGKPVEHDPNFKGPIKNRGCTDIICCIIFIIFFLGLVVVAFFAYFYGNPKLLLYPTDSKNDLCGFGKYKDKKFLYFFNLLTCLKGGPGVFIKGCPTTQVCVKECPRNFEVLYFPGKISECITEYCTHDSDPSERCETRIKNRKCPTYLAASSPVLNRCVPLPSKLRLSNPSFYDYTGKLLGNSTGNMKKSFDSAELLIQQFLKLKEFTDKIIQDVISTWWMIVIAYLSASLLSFIWIVLMRWITRVIIYMTIILFIGLFGFGVVWCFFKYSSAKDATDDKDFYLYLVVTSFSFSRSKFWLGLGIVSLVVFLIVVLIFIFLRKRIQLAVSLIAEGSKAVGNMMTTLIWPIIPFILQIGVITLWLTIAVYLASVGRGKSKDFMKQNLGMNETQKMIAPFNCTLPNPQTNDTLGEVCRFLKYGTDKYTFYLQIYNLFMFFWIINFVVALDEMTLAGAFSSYYWAMEKPKDIPTFALGSSFYRCFRFHLGTLAFGSLLIAIVKIIRVILEYIQNKLKDAKNSFAQCMLKCCMCCFWCLEKFLKFLNKNAYIMTAIYGKNFCVSAKRAFMLLMRNIVRVVVVDNVTDFILFIGKLVVTAGITCGAFFFFDRRIPGIESYTPTLNFYLAPVILIAVGTYVIACCFFTVYSMAVDTLFLCVLEDLERNDGTPERPYYMNKSLMKILEAKPKTSTVT